MAYFRNKSRTAAAELIEPDNSVELNSELDEDGLRREPDVDQPQRETVAPAEPVEPVDPPAPAQHAGRQNDEAALRSQIEALRRSEAIQQQRQAAAIDDQRRAEWLQNTPGAQQHFAALGPLHHEALRAGFDDLSEDYFRYLESGLEALAVC